MTDHGTKVYDVDTLPGALSVLGDWLLVPGDKPAKAQRDLLARARGWLPVDGDGGHTIEPGSAALPAAPTGGRTRRARARRRARGPRPRGCRRFLDLLLVRS